MKKTVYIFFTITLLLSGCSQQNSRLRSLVTNCLDISGENYCSSCRWPRNDSKCDQSVICDRSTEIWEENENYIAIRDKKMCGCIFTGFVHGLAIPRALITGVESANRPKGIWAFAWRAGINKGIPSNEMALVINPANDRSENQLHIHIVKLKKEARNLFPKEQTTVIGSLADVWKSATANASGNKLSFYGVLVSENPTGGYFVVVTENSPEDLYTVSRCIPD